MYISIFSLYLTSSHHAKRVIFLNQYTPTISLVPIDNNSSKILQKKGSDNV